MKSQHIRRWAFLGASAAIVAVLVAALAPSVVSANAGTRSTSDVFVIADATVAGTSTLVRNDNGVSMTFRTSGLMPGTVATIWWVVFNDPGACATSPCTSADLGVADGTAFYAAGHVIGASGRANYAAHLPVGRLTVDPDPDANQLLQVGAAHGLLKDAHGAEIHLVLRSHGSMIPDLVQHMISTHDGGCGFTAPGFPPEEIQGPNICENLQISRHLP